MHSAPKWRRRTANTMLAVLFGMALWPIIHNAKAIAGWFETDHEKLASAASVFEAFIVGISAIIAFRAYRSAMRTVAKQNTLDRIFEDHSDREVVEQRKRFRAIKTSSDDKLENYSHSHHREAYVQRRAAKEAANHNGGPPPKSGGEIKLDKKKRINFEKDFDDSHTAIIGVLNRYETFAVGISENAIDSELYKRWWRTQVINDWHAARAVIEKMRIEFAAPKLFVEFENLAKLWEREASKERTI